ncbi:hypothetical protein LH128_02349 [Sphingomonas sp. LH128]|nr:hypothetical protein LH128_02349 [Sphingomonas sp. LH128]
MKSLNGTAEIYSRLVCGLQREKRWSHKRRTTIPEVTKSCDMYMKTQVMVHEEELCEALLLLEALCEILRSEVTLPERVLSGLPGSYR